MSAQESVLLKAGTNEVEFIEFYVAGQSFGINVAKVKQVAQWNRKEITRLDGSAPEILGTYYFRGKPILAIDLKKALNLPEAEASEERQLILVAEFNQMMTGFLIDGVQQIHRKTWKDFNPMDSAVFGKSPYVVGNIVVGGRVILVIDFEYLTATIVPQSAKHLFHTEPIAKKAERKDIKIVYAEDSAMVRRYTSQQLIDAGFTDLKAFENGAQAYAYLQEICDEVKQGKYLSDLVNIVITDIEMPQMDGFTLCKQIKSELGMHDLPVVVYSSLINEQMSGKCKSVGADAHMSKPNIHQIANVVDRLCLGDAKT
jgi:two-component system, chemotaxis family, chemotaxis protein CheV